MERNWLIVVLLLGVVALNVMVALATPRPTTGDHPFFVLLTALCLSQIGVLGIWVVLSPQHWLLRWTMTAAVLGGWSWLIERHAPDLKELLNIHLLVTMAMVLPWRLRGYRWRSNKTLSEPEVRGAEGCWQFSIGMILRWTALVAIVCAQLQPMVPTSSRELVLEHLSYAAVLSIVHSPLLAPVAIWVFARRFASWGSVASILAVGILPGMLWSNWFIPRFLLPPLWFLNTTESVFFLAWFSACQMAGYSIRRE